MKHEEAETTGRECLSLCETSQVRERLDIFHSLIVMSCVLYCLKRYEEAELYQHRAAAGLEKDLGGGYVETVFCVENDQHLVQE